MLPVHLLEPLCAGSSYSLGELSSPCGLDDAGLGGQCRHAPLSQLYFCFGCCPQRLRLVCALPCRRPSHLSRSVVTAIGALARLLRDRKVRLLFQKSAGVQLLAPLLRQSSQSGPSNQQLLYEAGLCVWQLTFLPEATSVMGSSGIVQGLVEMARSAQKEKVRLPAAFAVAWPAICLSWLSNKFHLVLQQESTCDALQSTCMPPIPCTCQVFSIDICSREQPTVQIW